MNRLKTKKLIPIILLVFIIAWVAVIFSFSFHSHAASYSESGFVLAMLTKAARRLNIHINSGMYRVFAPFVADKSRITAEVFVRKAAHFTEYFILGIFCAVCFIIFRKKSRRWAAALLSGFPVAFIDERVIQRFFVVGRTPSYKDVLLDCIGFYCAVGLTLIIFLIYLLIKRLLRK